MIAVFETGGKQYKVAVGDIIKVEKLIADDGSVVIFDKVLAVVDGEKASFGAPAVEGATVEASVIKTAKGKKVIIFKIKAKKGYRKRQGHRQTFTMIKIEKINA